MQVAVVVGVCIGGAVCLCIAVSAILFFVLRSRHGKLVAEKQQETSIAHDHWPSHLSLSALPDDSFPRLLGARNRNSLVAPDDARDLVQHAGTPSPTSKFHQPLRLQAPPKSRKKDREALRMRSMQAGAIPSMDERPGRMLVSASVASHGKATVPREPSGASTMDFSRGVSPVPPSFPDLESRLTDIASMNHLSAQATRAFSVPNITPPVRASPNLSRPSTALVRSASSGGHASGLAPTTSLPPLPMQLRRESMERPMSYGSFMSDDTAASSVLWEANGALDRAAEIAHAPEFATTATTEDYGNNANVPARPNITVPAFRQDSSHAVLSQTSLLTSRRQSRRESSRRKFSFDTADLDHHIEGLNSLPLGPSTRNSRSPRSQISPKTRVSSCGSPTEWKRGSDSPPSDRMHMVEHSRSVLQSSDINSSNLGRIQEIEGRSVSSPSLMGQAAQSRRLSFSRSMTISSPTSSVMKRSLDKEVDTPKRRQTSHKKVHGVTPWSSGTTSSSINSSTSGTLSYRTTKADDTTPLPGLAPAQVSNSSLSLSDNNGYWTPAATTSSAEQHFEFPELVIPHNEPENLRERQNSFGPPLNSLSSAPRKPSPEAVARTPTPPPKQRQTRRSTARDHVPPVPVVPFIRFKPSRSTPLAASLMPRHGPPSPKHRAQYEFQRSSRSIPQGTVPRSYPTPALLYSAQELRRMNSEALGAVDASSEEQLYMHIGQPSPVRRPSGERVGHPWFSFRNRQDGSRDEGKENEAHAAAGAEASPSPTARRFWVSDAAQAAREVKDSTFDESRGVPL